MGLIRVAYKKDCQGASLSSYLSPGLFFPLAELKMKLSYNLVWQILDPAFDKHLKC